MEALKLVGFMFGITAYVFFGAFLAAGTFVGAFCIGQKFGRIAGWSFLFVGYVITLFVIAGIGHGLEYLK